MAIYLVKEMDMNKVLAVHQARAISPLKAASKAVGRDVTLRTWKRKWVRVTDENRGRVFAFSFADKVGLGMEDDPKQPGGTSTDLCANNSISVLPGGASV
ncbi:hypothetical protein [Mesorhizobium sp. B2-4-15]|uniref:hypothetical protein n=1 Tax=Mesorhizobium sp. B2-4-15 TaxID=2589934 RepID=UPI0015EFB9A8|nr:hypothetical protein [Mesorhizobium sp. B2-4-15]